MVQDGARPCNTMQYHAIPCNTMQYNAIPCNTMQYHASLITADGAYYCPVGSIMAIFRGGLLEINDVRGTVFERNVVRGGLLEINVF